MDKPIFRLPRREALKSLGALAVTSTTLAAVGCGSDEPATAPPAAAGSAAPPATAAGTSPAGTSGAASNAGASSGPPASTGSAGTSAAGASSGGSSGALAGSAGTSSAAGTGSAVAGSGGAPAVTGGATAPAAGSGGAAGMTTLDMLACVVTPAMDEGPFFIEEKLERSNLVMGETDDPIVKAVPLRLVMGLYKVDGMSCTPLSKIQVDIWHANAIGVYSDVASGVVQSTDTRGKKFLRGYQLTDEQGMVAFDTVYPGWYMSRAIHIHFKLRMPGGANTSYEFTSQMFFDEMINAKVVSQGVYAMRSGMRSTLNEMDHIYNGTPVGNTRPPANGMAPGKLIMPTLVTIGSGYEATLKIGLKV